MKGYKTSRDYKRLKELLDKGCVIVGYTTYDFNKYYARVILRDAVDVKPLMTTDVCEAKLAGKGTNYERYSFGVRGICYGEYWPEFKTPFEEWCGTEMNFEFIEPTED